MDITVVSLVTYFIIISFGSRDGGHRINSSISIINIIIIKDTNITIIIILRQFNVPIDIYYWHRSLRRVFPANQLRWYWQPKNNQKTK